VIWVPLSICGGMVAVYFAVIGLMGWMDRRRGLR
jgi:hypothetical protein